MIEIPAVVARELEAGGLPCVTSSFQAECVVLVHMLQQARPGLPVLFLDIVNLRADDPQVGLWQQSTQACCGRHKVEPLFRALQDYDVWFTGLRREQSPSRANLREVEPFGLPTGKTLRKVSPLAVWSTKDVWTYAKQHDIPLLPLYAQGYTSIGCAPCTSLPLDPSNDRSGRWAGQKLECGIHIQAVK
jgi:phosphoadenosine phosphosulfate reductase